MAEKLSIKEANDKLVRVNLAIKQLVETRSKSGKTLDRLVQLKEHIEKETYKPTKKRWQDCFDEVTAMRELIFKLTTNTNN